MKICLIGYGRMGREIERIAVSRDHEVVAKIDGEWSEIPTCDVAIEFTQPSAALDNILKCLSAGVPVVSGTTGWLERWDEAIDATNKSDGTLFYSSNFGIGVYLFSQVNKQLARMMNHYKSYEPTIEEIHHIHKLDYPSGTALSLANDVLSELDTKSKIYSYLAPGKAPEHRGEQLLIKSIRQDEVPGSHIIRYESPEDILEIRHEAKGRAALALGAVLAAEYIQGKKGVFGMKDLIQLD